MIDLFKYFLVVFTSIASLNYSCAQIEDKYEKEIRIKKAEFPQPALNLLTPIMEQDKRSRFYKEINKNSYSYEYKSTYNKEKISIKFSQTGSLEDIEVKKELNSLAELIQIKIKEHFSENFDNFKIKKTQIQYTPVQRKDESYSEYFNKFLNEKFDELTIKYEIETEVINPKKERGYFEFLFNANGEIEKVKKIIERADDNILY